MHNIKNIIILIADAWKPSIIQKLIESQQLPNIQKYFLGQGIYIKDCQSIVPSISLCSHTSLLTGFLPNKHGVLGHRWLDKSSGVSKYYLGLHRDDPNLDINPQTKTIFEIVHPAPSLAIYSLINRGATKKISPRSFRNVVVMKTLLANLQKDINYKVIVCWLPEVDYLSHSYGCESVRIMENIKMVDFYIGQLFNILSREGLLDRYTVVLTSDHGHRNVNKHVNLCKILKKLGVKAKYSQREFATTKKDNDTYKIFLNGQASAYIYLPQNQRDNLKDLKYLSSNLIRYEGIDKCLIRNSNEITIKTSTKKRKNGKKINPEYLKMAKEFLKANNAPDFLVFSEDGFDFSNGIRFGFRFGYHKSTHGGISEDEMKIFSSIWDYSLNGQAIQSGCITDILPTALHLAGYSKNLKFDGKCLICN
jgi:hypothetical protein